MNKQRMKIISIALLLLLLTTVSTSPMFAQSDGWSYTATCEGYFYGYEATLTGQEQYSEPNILGNSYLTFQGTLTIQGWEFPLVYEDYSNLYPYEGYIQLDQDQSYSISVLPDSGGEFIIYDGGFSLYAPETLGEFTCSWN
jgi:hypothetical protein